MGRPRGSRNADYEQKRRRLARRAVRALVSSPAEHTSLRELARAADVSVSTMRHYFDDRSGIVEAALEEMGRNAQRFLDDAIERVYGPLDVRLRAYLRGIVDAWTTYRVGRAHAVGMAEGLYADVGRAYVEELMEPFLLATEQLLEALQADGHARFADTRMASVALLTPVTAVLAHQESLGGQESRPMDLEDFLDAHVDAFCRGWNLPA